MVTTIVFQNLSTWAKIRLSSLNALVYRHTTNGDITATPVNTGMLSDCDWEAQAAGQPVFPTKVLPDGISILR